MGNSWLTEEELNLYTVQDSSFQAVKVVEQSLKVLVLNFLISRQSEAQLKFQLR